MEKEQYYLNSRSEITVETNQKLYLRLERSKESWISPAHYHDSFELCIPIKGNNKICINGVMYDMTVGEVLFINSFEVHYFDIEKDSEYIACRIHKDMLKDFFEEYKREGQEPRFPRVLKDIEGNKRLVALIQEWRKCFWENNLLQQRGFVNLLYGELAKIYSPQFVDVERDELGRRILEYISQNFTQDINLSRLAKQFGYSKNSISRTLHGLIGQDLRSYVGRLRVEHAYRLIKNNPHMTVQVAAMESGFASMNTFYRASSKYVADEETAQILSREEDTT